MEHSQPLKKDTSRMAETLEITRNVQHEWAAACGTSGQDGKKELDNEHNTNRENL
jgi:hypothetical protein